MKRIYLDYAATTPTHPQVVQAMLPYFTDAFGNPSSIHYFGQEVKAAVEETRGKIASFIGAKSEEIVFTSGGTESNNFAIKGIAHAREDKGKHIISSSVEHHSVIEPCRFLEGRGFKVTYLPVDENGLIHPEDVAKAISDDTILVSVMQANNEVGTIQPIEEIAEIAKEKGVYLHTDAVQTVGHIPVNVQELGVDLLSMSAHKLYGPKGIGALYIRKGTRISSVLHGGEQEQRRRASTENVPGIIGFGKAIEIVREEMAEEMKRLTSLRDKLIQGLLESIDNIRLNGHPKLRLSNNINVSVDFVEGEAMLLNLDLAGIAASSGSACSSDSLGPSHVLSALGLPPEQARCSLRFTLGRGTTEEDITQVLETLPPIVAKLRAMSPLLKTKA